MSAVVNCFVVTKPVIKQIFGIVAAVQNVLQIAGNKKEKVY